ncbi:hypothetical protein [Aquimarina longa]|uniref:hypothetical protein n=1 Tax=Aquimarina longa TaxID=1080221 RepID=UPI00078054B3|nr:hypothetical protein [Aquimarina longa]
MKYLKFKSKLFLAVSVILLSSLIGCAQNKEDQLKYNSELVFFNDLGLVKLLENIIIDKNSCKNIKKSIDWYIDFKESESIVVSEGRIANLIELIDPKKRKIYTTTINNKVVFLLMANKKGLLSKTGLSIDLSSFSDKSTLSFEDFSSWLIKSQNGSYKIADSQIWKCK